jgi:hypothetical protein
MPDQTAELRADGQVVPDVAEAPAQRPEEHRWLGEPVGERTSRAEGGDEVSFGVGTAPDELDQLLLGAASLEASDHVENTRLAHPQ